MDNLRSFGNAVYLNRDARFSRKACQEESRLQEYLAGYGTELDSQKWLPSELNT